MFEARRAELEAAAAKAVNSANSRAELLEGKEVVIVANNVGVLDTRCDNCGRRIVETRIVENEKVEN